MLYKFLLVIILPSVLLSKNITVCGTGEGLSLLKKIALAYENTYKNINVIIPNSIGSSGAVKSVYLGNCDIGRVSRSLNSKELTYKLNYIPLTKMAIVFALSSNLKSISNLSSRDIVDIYSGKKRKWNSIGKSKSKSKSMDDDIYVARREKGDSLLINIEKKIDNFSKIISPAGKVLYSTQKMSYVLSKYKSTIGYLSYSEAKVNGLNIVNIDGVSPSLDNLQNGSYPLSIIIGVIYRDDINIESMNFIRFLNSNKVKSILGFHSVLQTK